MYAITPDSPDTEDLLRRVRQALTGGVRLLQYRNKSATPALREVQARALRELTREFGATFIVNDDIDLALAVDADGAHIGADDGCVMSARPVLGEDKIIGISCYNQLPRAQAVAKAGADYVAFGAFFPSGVKPNAIVANIELLQTARALLKVPVVAIGGITAENGAELIEAGAHALAVISALFDAGDVTGKAQEFTNLFKQHSTQAVTP